MEAVVFSSFLLPSEERVKPRFCSAGCVKCSPVSLALRSDGSSSCVRSECSSSTLSSSGGGNNGLLFSFGPFRGGLNQVSRRVPSSRKLERERKLELALLYSSMYLLGRWLSETLLACGGGAVPEKENDFQLAYYSLSSHADCVS
ncbi:unnamed protein product [Sphagnum compactum]